MVKRLATLACKNEQLANFIHNSAQYYFCNCHFPTAYGCVLYPCPVCQTTHPCLQAVEFSSEIQTKEASSPWKTSYMRTTAQNTVSCKQETDLSRRTARILRWGSVLALILFQKKHLCKIHTTGTRSRSTLRYTNMTWLRHRLWQWLWSRGRPKSALRIKDMIVFYPRSVKKPWCFLYPF